MQYNPWYYTHTGQRHGPVSNDEIRKLIIERKIQPELCKLWQEGMENWVPISEVEAFRPSLELIERLDKQANLPSKHKYCSLQAALDARRPKKRSTIFEKYNHLGLILRLTISLYAFSLVWAWLNEYLTGTYVIPAILCPLISLVFAGPYPHCTLIQRAITGLCSSLGFTLSWYLGYLTNHGAQVWVNLMNTMRINRPIAFLNHYLDWDSYFMLLVTFWIPFLFLGLLYKIPAGKRPWSFNPDRFNGLDD